MRFLVVLVKNALIRKKHPREMTKKRLMSHIVEGDEFMNNTLEDIICDIIVDALQRDMEDLLYPEYKSVTRMSVVLRIFNLKTKGG